ncbi:MAG TPA: CDP-diacylglycerol--glycerol-3-phosphate 3-phosphatidyltransferase, partial [Thermodesulfobacteriota bacterium]
ASVTDYLDGYLSRSRNEVSRLGKLLDPMADKLLIAAVFITLVELGRVAAWIVILIVARELAVTGLRAMAAAEGLVVPADTLGKWKMVAQIVAAIALILSLEPIATPAVWVAVVLTVWSGVDYVRRYSFLFDESRR